jgi:hypothetical protein
MGITTLMRELIDPYGLTVALTSRVQFMLFLRWLYRRIRNHEMTRTFVEDMATSHLPQSTGCWKNSVTRRELKLRRNRPSAG